MGTIDFGIASELSYDTDDLVYGPSLLFRPTVLWLRAADSTGLACLAFGFFAAVLECTIWVTGVFAQVAEPYTDAHAYFIQEGSQVFVYAFSNSLCFGAIFLIPMTLIEGKWPYLYRVKPLLVAHIPLFVPIAIWSFAYMCAVTNEPDFQLLSVSAWLQWPLWRFLGSLYWLPLFALVWLTLSIRGFVAQRRTFSN